MSEIINQINPLTIVIICIMIITFLVIIMSLNGSIRRTRIHYASIMGKIEHFAGRLIGIFLIIDMILAYYNYKYIIYPIAFSFAIWALYLLSHTFEKKLYGNFGPRG